jgi:hypothetical protein
MILLAVTGYFSPDEPLQISNSTFHELVAKGV